MESTKLEFPEVCCSCFSDTDLKYTLTEARHSGASIVYQQLKVPMCASCAAEAGRLDFWKGITTFCGAVAAVAIGLAVKKDLRTATGDEFLVTVFSFGLGGAVLVYTVANWVFRHLRSVYISYSGNVHFRNKAYAELFREINTTK